MIVVGVMMLISVLRNLRLDRLLGEDWPIFVGTFLLIIFMSMRDLRKSRGPLPMPMPKSPPAEGTPGKLPFEIPELKGAPKKNRNVAKADRAPLTPEEEEDAIRLAEAFEANQKKQQRQEAEAREQAAREAARAEARRARFSPDTLRNAFIYSEIFAPPKALRRRVKR